MPSTGEMTHASWTHLLSSWSIAVTASGVSILLFAMCKGHQTAVGAHAADLDSPDPVPAAPAGVAEHDQVPTLKGSCTLH